MSRLIDADKLKAHYAWWHDMEDVYTNNSLQQDAEDLDTIIDVQPTVDPVKHGRWDLIDGCEPIRYGCSVCHRMVWAYENYCPNCGAKMDGESNEMD